MGLLIREILANKKNFGGVRPISSIKYIVLHYTANDGDKAENNAKYFQTPHNPPTSAHYITDDYYIIRSVPDNFIAYSVGGKKYTDCAFDGRRKVIWKSYKCK